MKIVFEPTALEYIRRKESSKCLTLKLAQQPRSL